VAHRHWSRVVVRRTTDRGFDSVWCSCSSFVGIVMRGLSVLRCRILAVSGSSAERLSRGGTAVRPAVSTTSARSPLRAAARPSAAATVDLPSPPCRRRAEDACRSSARSPRLPRASSGPTHVALAALGASISASHNPSLQIASGLRRAIDSPGGRRLSHRSAATARDLRRAVAMSPPSSTSTRGVRRSRARETVARGARAGHHHRPTSLSERTRAGDVTRTTAPSILVSSSATRAHRSSRPSTRACSVPSGNRPSGPR